MRTVAAAMEAYRRQLEPLLRESGKVAIAVMAACKEVEKAVTKPLTDKLFKAQRQIAPVLDALARDLQKLPTRIRSSLATLGSHGWFIHPEFPITSLLNIAASFDARDTEKADRLLCDHFDQALDEVETTLAKRHSTRSRILSAAFTAHRSGSYATSIPVFLAQADGICKEALGVQLYSRDKGSPIVARHLKFLARDFLLTLLTHPLTLPLPISASEKERASLPDVLNRHAVLHGDSVDYDTRVNSCKAVSLLVYVSWVLAEVCEKVRKRKR